MSEVQDGKREKRWVLSTSPQVFMQFMLVLDMLLIIEKLVYTANNK